MVKSGERIREPRSLVSIYENREVWIDRPGFMGFYWVLIGLGCCCLICELHHLIFSGSLFGSREMEENEDANFFLLFFFSEFSSNPVLFFLKLSLFGKWKRNEDAIWVINCDLEDFLLS
jgi:hypothetical protein